MRCSVVLTFETMAGGGFNDGVFVGLEGRCRTCLAACAAVDVLAKCVEVGGETLSLAEVILSCASVQISEQDGLPNRICESCKDAAVKSHMFKIQCESSDRYLKSVIYEQKTQNFSSTQDVINFGPEETIELVVETYSTSPTPDTPHALSNQDSEEETATKSLPLKPSPLPPSHSPAPDLIKRTCPSCNKVFQYRTSMLKHQRKHNAPPKTCSYCPFQPPTPSALSKHMELNHAHLKTFTCSLCAKAFFKKSNLRLHVQMHSGVKKHTCEICGLSFVSRGNLSVHRRLHTGEKPYTCSVCGRGFVQQSALRSHEAGHSDRRDHVCQECGAAFSRVGALRNHQKRHLEDKPFECGVCGRRFTFSSERKRHMMIHSGDKKFECEVCGRRFSRNTNLKVHRRIHTGETPHVCGVCGKGFIQAHCLRTHMNTHKEVE